MRDIIEIFNDLAELSHSAVVTGSGSCPVRCELCGTWGRSGTAVPWICDDCVEAVFLSRSGNDGSLKLKRLIADASEDQLELELN